MDSTWTNSTWKNSNFNYRQIVSFVVSGFILFLILLIPFKGHRFITQSSKTITIQLVKSQTPIKQAKKIETIRTVSASTDKQIEKTKEKNKTLKAKPVVTKIIHRKPKVKNNQAKTASPKLPSAGLILNSLRNRPYLENVGRDFQVANNDFLANSLVPAKEDKLIVDKYLLQVNVSETLPLGTKVLKVLASKFSLVPIDDKVKTQDMLPYCFNLGRNSSYCPTDNPLEN